jgi:N-acetylneuraminic acid mutarotase
MHTRSLVAATTLLLAALGCGDHAQSPTEPGVTAPTRPEAAITSNSWITRPDLWSNQYSDFATAVVPNAVGQSILYVIGGRSATGASLSKVMAYNVATNRWAVRAPLPIAVHSTNGAAVINGKIYISGGQMKYKYYLDKLYMYDPATNTWTQKQSMPTNGFDGLTGVIDDKLYVVTGCHSQEEDCGYIYYPNGDHPDRWLFRYDPLTDTWTELAVPPRYYAPVGGTIGEKLYLGSIGVQGSGGANILQVYDPGTNTWTEKATSRDIRWGAAYTTLGAKLYMIGGDGYPPLRRTDVYDPATNTWTTKARMPTGRVGAAARVFVDGKARIEFVGGPRPGNNLQYIP